MVYERFVTSGWSYFVSSIILFGALVARLVSAINIVFCTARRTTRWRGRSWLLAAVIGLVEPCRTYALLNHKAHAELSMSKDVWGEERWSYQHIASKLEQD